MGPEQAHDDSGNRRRPPIAKNGYVIGCEETREGVLIDPGDEVDLLLDAVRRHGLSVRYILLTHAHFDHITGVKRAKEAFAVPVGLHRDDEFLYRAVVQQGMAFGMPVEPQPPIDFYYDGPGPWRFGRYGVWVSIRQGTRRAVCVWPWGRNRTPRDPSSSATRCSRGASAEPICRGETWRRCSVRFATSCSSSLMRRPSTPATVRRPRSAASGGRTPSSILPGTADHQLHAADAEPVAILE